MNFHFIFYLPCNNINTRVDVILKTHFMTKKYFLLVIIMLAGLIGEGQRYFEGEINYKFDFKSDKIKEPGKLLIPVIGVGSILYFKEGNYRHEFEGGTMEFDIYNREENKMYQKKRNNDTIYWTDCSKANNNILDSVFSPKTDTVLGIICDRFAIQYKEASEVHYYNSDSIYINPEWFKNFKLNDEYFIDLREKSIYLKNEYSLGYFKLIETATKIIRQIIDIEKFRIPKNSILIQQD